MATDRTERLLNLVICLLGAQRPVSRAALRAGIPGYGDAASTEAFERMFERDKDELRQMGIPVETVVNSQGEVEGYLIDETAYAMPPVALDAAELSVLGLAARVWTEAALAAEAGAALRKIEATTGERLTPPELMVSRPGSGEEHLPEIWEALRLRKAVTFDYLGRGRDAPESRLVEPWATVHRQGAWYLIGFSRERDAERAFRMSRIVGPVARTGESFEMPDDPGRWEAVVSGIAEPPRQGVATISLPDTGAVRLRERARPRADGAWDLEYTDERSLVADVIEAGGRVLSPLDAAEEQRIALQRVLDLHGSDDA